LFENAVCQNHLFWPFPMITWACWRSVLADVQECWHHYKSSAGYNFLRRIFYLEADPEAFLPRIVTSDQTWICHWNLETKRVHALETVVHTLPRSFEPKCQLERSWQ
jgi:hypothetical protein